MKGNKDFLKQKLRKFIARSPQQEIFKEDLHAEEYD